MSAVLTPPFSEAREKKIRPDALVEIVDGMEVEVPEMGVFSSLLGYHLGILIGNFLDGKPLGRACAEMLFVLNSDPMTKRRPDVAFVSAERWPMDVKIPRSGDWAVVPDLAIEIASPNDSFEDFQGKLSEYFQYGVRQTWIVSPQARSIQIYDSPTKVRILTENETIDGGSILPGFAFKIADLFARAD